MSKLGFYHIRFRLPDLTDQWKLAVYILGEISDIKTEKYDNPTVFDQFQAATVCQELAKLGYIAEMIDISNGKKAKIELDG